MESTISDTQKSIDKLMNEPDPPLRLHPRESYPEIKTPLAQAIKDTALLVLEKGENISKWKNNYSDQESIRKSGRDEISETVNSLEITLVQRSDSSVSIEIFDSAYLDATIDNYDISARHYEFQVVDINSRGEVVSFLPSHSIYERMGINKEEFAHLVAARLEGMADKIDRRVALEKKTTLELDSVSVANESEVVKLTPEVAAQSKEVESAQEAPVAVVASNSSAWIESLKSQIDNIDGSKLPIFSGSSKVYERNNNEVTLDKLENTLGQKVQQALENPSELKGSVRVVVDGEKIYQAKDGELVKNTHSLALETTQVVQQKILDAAPEIPQVIEVQAENVQVAQEKNLENITEVPQVAEIQQENLQVVQEKSSSIIPEAPQEVEVQEQNLQVAQKESLDIITETSPAVKIQQEAIQAAQEESLNITSETSQLVELESQNRQVALPPPETHQIIPQKEEAKVDFIPPQEIVVPVKNERRQSSSTQTVQPTNSEAKEKAIFNLIARQEMRINLLEQKLAAQSQPLSARVNQWLEKVNQTAQLAVKEVKERSLHIPQSVRQFLANKFTQIQNSINEQVSAARTKITNKVNEQVAAVRSGVVGKVNGVKTEVERKLADVAGASLNASTRYLAERFGVDNGSGIKVFQGNSLVITSSKEHSGIYCKEGKQLVRDGQFISVVN